MMRILRPHNHDQQYHDHLHHHHRKNNHNSQKMPEETPRKHLKTKIWIDIERKFRKTMDIAFPEPHARARYFQYHDLVNAADEEKTRAKNSLISEAMSVCENLIYEIDECVQVVKRVERERQQHHHYHHHHRGFFHNETSSSQDDIYNTAMTSLTRTHCNTIVEQEKDNKTKVAKEKVQEDVVIEYHFDPGTDPRYTGAILSVLRTKLLIRLELFELIQISNECGSCADDYPILRTHLARFMQDRYIAANIDHADTMLFRVIFLRSGLLHFFLYSNNYPVSFHPDLSKSSNNNYYYPSTASSYSPLPPVSTSTTIVDVDVDEDEIEINNNPIVLSLTSDPSTTKRPSSPLHNPPTFAGGLKTVSSSSSSSKSSSSTLWTRKFKASSRGRKPDRSNYNNGLVPTVIVKPVSSSSSISSLSSTSTTASVSSSPSRRFFASH